MNKWWRLTGGLVLGVIATGPLHAEAVPGATAAEFKVEQGTASYRIPLTLPPGIGGMKPELSLSYSSRGGDGPIGSGWSIEGLSAISVCTKNHSESPRVR